MSIPTVVSALLLAAAPLLGQVCQPAPDSSRTAPAAQTDKDVEEAIRIRFAASKISTNSFEVRVKRCVAILRGSTDVMQHKGVATRLAKLAGATKVDNRIKLTERARLKAATSRRSKARRVKVEWRKPARTER